MTNIKALIKVFHKHKSYTAINIFGLSVGFALLMVIVLLLRFDHSYDKHWTESEKIFRIDYKFFQENSSDQLALSSKLLPERLLNTIPEIQAYARYSRPRSISVKMGEDLFSEQRVIYADNQTINLFELDFIEGNPEDLLNAPFEVIISDELAKKWFEPGQTVLNQIVLIKNKYHTVKGIYKALPKNTHLYFDGLMSYESIMDRYDNYEPVEFDKSIWLPDAYCYIKLRRPEDHLVVERKVSEYINQNIQPIIEATGSNEILQPILVPLEETHFSTGSDYDQAKGNNAFIKATAIIGLVIMLIISINYANLSMSILSQRHKELSMRRLLGASRLQVISQIILESFFCVLLSFFIAIIWLFLIAQLVPLEPLTGRTIDFLQVFDVENLVNWAGGIVGISIISSLYPAIVFSRANIIEVNERKRTGKTFTNLMIGVQFVASFMVITSMLLMKSQLSMLMDFDLGITEEPIVSIELSQTSSPEQIKLTRDQLGGKPGVIQVTDAVIKDENLIGVYHINAELETPTQERTELVFTAGFVGSDYCDVFDIDLIAGRKFRRNESEKNSVLVNQKFADQYYNGQALNKPIYFRETTYNIVGVVENFYYQSLREDLDPMAIFPRVVYNNDAAEPIETSFQIKIDQTNQKRTLAVIEEVFAQHYPNFPFNYKFVSDKVNSFYQDDQNDAALTGILGFSAILIAIFGLVGLVSFEINQRLKELSIRKVLGAKPKALFFIISQRQLYLLIAACIISIPATYLFISDWLNEFSFTINLGLSLFFTTLLTLIIVVILVMIAMALKFMEVIRINPAKTLHHD